MIKGCKNIGIPVEEELKIKGGIEEWVIVQQMAIKSFLSILE